MPSVGFDADENALAIVDAATNEPVLRRNMRRVDDGRLAAEYGTGMIEVFIRYIGLLLISWRSLQPFESID